MKNHTSFSAKQLSVIAALLLCFGGLTIFLFTFRQDEKRFTNITGRLFVNEMTANTLNMHYSLAFPGNYGIYDYTPALPVYVPKSAAGSQIATENTLASLNAIHSEKLSPSDAYLHTLLTRSLENSLELGRFPYYQEPLSPVSGMQSQLPILLAEYTFRTRQDVEDYLNLLDQTDEYFASLLLYEQEKSEAGLILPAFALQKVREQCDGIITSEELERGTHFLQTTFRERLEPLCEEGILSLAEAQEYLSLNDRLLKTVLLPAYGALGDGLLLLEDGSVPLTGLAGLPDGQEYYEALIKSETGSYRPIDEIQSMLTGQFTAVFKELQDLAAANPTLLQNKISPAAVSFPCSGAEEMLASLREKMAQDFPALPEEGTHVSVKAVSESLSDYCAPAFYLTAPLDDTSQNVIYINGQKTAEGVELYTTLAHEGYPGHLYQTVYDNQDASRDGDRPVRKILWYSGYLEGWALYAEFVSFDYASQLLTEQGLETEALWVQVEKCNRSLQLCLYSMLDILIHYENASYDKAAEILKRFGITDTASIQSIYAYIALEPCNYLKYYLGYLEVLSLKEQAKELWQESYSDYQFHTFLLETGPSDFASLQEALTAWGSGR